MQGNYIIVPQDFSDNMQGEISTVDNTTLYTDAAYEGQIITAAWLVDFFQSDFSTLGTLNTITITWS